MPRLFEPAPYWQLSCVFRQWPAELDSSNWLAEFFNEVVAGFGSDATSIYVGTDDNGRISSRPIDSLPNHAFAMSDQSVGSRVVSAHTDNKTEPLIGVGVSIDNMFPALTWTLDRSAVPESAFVSIAESQVRELIEFKTIQLFGGIGFDAMSSWPGSPIFGNAEVWEWSLDYASQMPGIHWLNAVPVGLLDSFEIDALRSLGARVTEGELVVVQLTDTPSALHDDIVAEAMIAVERVTPSWTASLPRYWWRALPML